MHLYDNNFQLLLNDILLSIQILNIYYVFIRMPMIIMTYYDSL